MRSAFGFHVRARALVARATESEAALVVAEGGVVDDLPGTLRRLAAEASARAGAADSLAVAHRDDLDEQGLNSLRNAVAAAGLDALLVSESVARTYAGEVDGDSQIVIGAARYALGDESRSGAAGGVVGGAAGGVAAGAAAGVAGRAPGGDSADPTMSDFGSGRDASQFGEGSRMSDFGDRSMSDFGEGRDMSDFAQKPDQPSPPQTPAPAAAPPPPKPAKSKAKVAVAAAVAVAVVAVVAVVALASNSGDDDTSVATGGTDTTAAADDEDDSPATDEDSADDDESSGPTAGGPIVLNGHDGTSSQIYIAEPDGSEVRQVSRFGEGDTPIFHFTEVEWAPDGKTIYFTGNRADDEDGAPALWAMDADGSNVRELQAAGRPVFSIDVGSDGRIVALRGQAPSERALVVLDAQGGSEQRVMQGQIDLDPTWAPDGTIVFVRASAEGTALFRVNDDGSGLQQLVATFGFTAAPDVSPDGDRITWIASRSADDRTPALWVANADGTDPRTIEGFEGGSVETAGTPRWTKNSEFLLMTSDDGAVVLVNPDSGEQTPLFQDRQTMTIARYDVLTAAAGVEAGG